jgi:hypothetical protein
LQSLQVLAQAEDKQLARSLAPVRLDPFEDPPDGRPSKLGDMNSRVLPPNLLAIKPKICRMLNRHAEMLPC